MQDIKKTLEYYLSLPYHMEIISDKEEGGFTAWYPELPGCLTCAETIEETIGNAEDAKKEWITAALEQGLAIVEPTIEGNCQCIQDSSNLKCPKAFTILL